VNMNVYDCVYQGHRKERKMTKRVDNLWS